MKKRTTIDQKLCDHVKLLMAGGANAYKAAEITGIGHATVSRIKTAGFNAEVYRANVEAQRVKEQQKLEKQAEELPGQISMELAPAKEQKQELTDETKIMRFQAAMVDRLIMELDKMNDTLNQFIRVMRRE